VFFQREKSNVYTLQSNYRPIAAAAGNVSKNIFSFSLDRKEKQREQEKKENI
jgi:hypothetical protein